MKKRYLWLMILLSLFFSNNLTVYAVGEWSFVTLDQLEDIKDNPAKLQQVEVISAEKEDDINNLKIASKCPNLQNLVIVGHEISNIEDLNNIDVKELSLSLQDVYADFSNFQNESITQLYISQSSIKNIEGINNLQNIYMLSIESTDNAEMIDFSKLTKLEILSLESLAINDYNSLINRLKHIKELSLASTNFTNKDTTYLTRITNLKGLNLAATYVDNLDFLPSLKNLKDLSLPYGMENLDILYELPYLESVSWDAYTELQVTTELVSFLDKNNINHSNFVPEVNTLIDDIITSLKLENKSTIDKIYSITKYVAKNTVYKGVAYDGTSLQKILIGKYGVCHNFSILTYTLLKKIGINVFYVSGYAEEYMDETELIKFSKGSHAWNNVEIDGKWYGIDTTWINSTEDEIIDVLSESWIMQNLENSTNEFNRTHVSINQPKDTFKVEQNPPSIGDNENNENEENKNNEENNHNQENPNNRNENNNIQNPNTGAFISIVSIVTLISIGIYCLYKGKKMKIFHKI